MFCHVFVGLPIFLWSLYKLFLAFESFLLHIIMLCRCCCCW